MAFMILATWLYLNAWCVLSMLSVVFLSKHDYSGKGEECIPQTWDMFHEKWGFMVIFWNFAGVPFVRLSCPLQVDPSADPSFRPMCTLWFTWPHMTPPSTSSLPQLTFCCSLRF